MPESWARLLSQSEITISEQRKNPQTVLDVLNFYESSTKKEESKFLTNIKPPSEYNVPLQYLTMVCVCRGGGREWGFLLQCCKTGYGVIWSFTVWGLLKICASRVNWLTCRDHFPAISLTDRLSICHTFCVSLHEQVSHVILRTLLLTKSIAILYFVYY